MSRIVDTGGVGQERNQLRRTIAESLHRLVRRPQFDEESRDLAALIVFSLHHLQKGVEQTAAAWENRDYFLKADRFRREWAWIEETNFALETALLLGQWDKVPEILTSLIPRFSDVTISRYTRSESAWQGCYQRLVHDKG